MMTITIPPFELDVNMLTLIALNNISPDLKTEHIEDTVPTLYGDVVSNQSYDTEETCKEYLSDLLKEFGTTEYSEELVKSYLRKYYDLDDASYDELYVLVHTYFKGLDYGNS